MNIDQVLAFLERKEQMAGKFAQPHWRNAIKEVGYAKHMEVEDRVFSGRGGAQQAEPANRPVKRPKLPSGREQLQAREARRKLK